MLSQYDKDDYCPDFHSFPIKMDAQVSELIRNASTPSGASVSGTTYGTLFGIKSRFDVCPSKLPEFLSRHCDLAAKDENDDDESGDAQKCGLSIGELVTSKTTPLMITMLFRFNIPEESRDDPSLYGEDFILAIANVVQTMMSEKLELSPTMSELICFVLESKPWDHGENTFVRMRFHFPYAQVDNGYQRKTLKPRLISLLRQQKVINRMETHPVGDWDVILEDTKDIVGLYRSKDEVNQAPMSLTHIYNFVEEDHVASGKSTEVMLADVFIPVHHSFIYRGMIPGTFLAGEIDLRHWLPLLFSVNFWSGVVRPKELEDTDSTSQGGGIRYDDRSDDKDPMSMIQHLLPLVSIERYNREDYWLDIGRILYNVSGGTEEGLNMWIAASNKATVLGRDKSACMEVYYTLRDSPLTEKTIAWFARQDSKHGYGEWHTAWCQNALTEALSQVHDDVAEAVYRVFWLDYMCTGLGKNSWYMFDKHRLKPLDDAVYLRKDITNVLIPIYKKMRHDSSEESLSLNGKESEKKHLESLISQIGGLIKKLGNQGYRSSIVNMAREKFYVEGFDLLKDANPTKTGWINGVVECCGGTAYFRGGKPEDFITMTTFIPYRSEFTWENPVVIELMKWLSQAFPDEELLRYFLKDSASMLLGKNSEKLFRVWSGEGDNGKSMIVKLYQATLGMYCIDFPVQMLCGKTFSSSSGPNPELAQAKGSHAGIISEPDADEELQAGKLKRFTGGDRFFGRLCNENGGSIEAFFKLIFMCNRIPNIPGADRAVRARFQIMPYVSTWSKDAPESEEEQRKLRIFKMDPFFDRRVPELAQAFAWVIVEYFALYKAEGLIAPPIVREYTERHWQENDPYINFIRERIVMAFKNVELQEVDVTATITASDMYSPFKLWFRDNFPGAEIPAQPRFRQEMLQNGRLGPQNSSSRRWIGIKINAPQVAITPIGGL